MIGKHAAVAATAFVLARPVCGRAALVIVIG